MSTALQLTSRDTVPMTECLGAKLSRRVDDIILWGCFVCITPSNLTQDEIWKFSPVINKNVSPFTGPDEGVTENNLHNKKYSKVKISGKK
jgi:hypothetical protein